ncbi:MAG: hypothetical protein D6722_08400 [Bacteroidetes bacterium]|nr:MAG: hypothetical protein D6722_08400 [Bacteroidota bacterium]
MGKTLLIHSLGNRDLQLSKAAPIPGEFRDKYFEDNSEGLEERVFYVVKKDRFRDHCRDLHHTLTYGLDQAEKAALETHLEMPILMPVLRKVAKRFQGIDRLMLLATQQPIPFRQDTDEAAKIAALLLHERYSREAPDPKQAWLGEIEIRHFDSKPGPERKARMIRECAGMLEDAKKDGFDRIFISPVAGLPALTEALIFVGYFQNYTYYEPIALTQEVIEMDFGEQEQILAQNVKDRLISLIRDANLSQL